MSSRILRARRRLRLSDTEEIEWENEREDENLLSRDESRARSLEQKYRLNNYI